MQIGSILKFLSRLSSSLTHFKRVSSPTYMNSAKERAYLRFLSNCDVATNLDLVWWPPEGALIQLNACNHQRRQNLKTGLFISEWGFELPFNGLHRCGNPGLGSGFYVDFIFLIKFKYKFMPK